MQNKRVLAIDDERKFEDLKVNVIARTFADGINSLKFLGPWDELLLDHDLGAVQQQFSDERELTGYDILCFLEENPEYLPKKITLVTSNASGRVRMNQVIEKLYPRGY